MAIKYIPALIRHTFLMTAAGAVLLGFGLAVVGGPGPAAAQANTPLLTETFTGATADPRFEGYGAACLTGAAAGEPPGGGGQALGGCGVNRAGPVPPAGGAPFGYLQLTDAGNDRSGAVLFQQPIPANQGLEVTFEQWQYGSTTPQAPADGIAFFLVDGSGGLSAPGAFGGSLGYAQKLPDNNPANEFQPGVDNGYLGIGLDVLGNFFGDWEQRGSGCEERSPAGTAFHIPAPGANMVTVRGPGHGTVGYCFLTATTSNFSTSGPWPSTLPGQLQGTLTSLPPGVTAEQAATLLEPSKRTVTVRITPAPDPQVTVEVDFQDGNGPQRVLEFAAPQPVPPTYKFGFSASTGLFTDVHLIRNVHVSSAAPLPALNLVKQVDTYPPLPPEIVVGTEVRYEFVVTNAGNVPVADLVLTDPVAVDVSCPTTTLVPRETTVCTATHAVTQADIDRGMVVNTAVASGNTSEGGISSPESDAIVEIQSQGAELSLAKVASPVEVSAAGQRVDYEFLVKNIGFLTVTGLEIVDVEFSGTGPPPVVSCPDTALAPGEEAICTGSYEVTQADIDTGVDLTNSATAAGMDPAGGSVVSGPSDAAVGVVAEAALALDKSVDPASVAVAGEEVTYSVDVTNSGAVTLSELLIEERAFTGSGTPPVLSCPVDVLAPGETTTCTGGYVVTEADIYAGSISNTAVAEGTTGAGERIVSDPAEAEITVIAEPDEPERPDRPGRPDKPGWPGDRDRPGPGTSPATAAPPDAGNLPDTGNRLGLPLAVGGALTVLGGSLWLAGRWWPSRAASRAGRNG